MTTDPKRIGLYLLVGGLLTLTGDFILSSQAQESPPAGAASAHAQPTPAPTREPFELPLTATADASEPAPPPPAAPVEPPSEPTATATAQPRPQATTVQATPAPPPPPPTSTPIPPPPPPISTPVRPPPASTSVPPPPPPTSTPAPPPPASVSLTAMEQELFNAHNAERARAGVAGLQLDATLVEIARQRARDMAANNYFSHTSPTGETAFTLMAKAGYVYSIAGENIARNNYPDAQAASVAMAGFMNSPGHKANILDARFKVAGFGAAIGADGMKYFVVVFAGN